MVNFKSDEQRHKLYDKIWQLRRSLVAQLELMQGNEFFSDAVFDSENLDIDGIYDSLDCCGNSQKMAFEMRDTELEARCEAFIGRIYYKGLKKLPQAKRHMSNSIRLENTLRPRNCSGEAWF